ncbi:MAG: GtrA family protein [Lachnospiraceae bacterium]|nr:GtrA family protein [Lachnospiraceae bacterium]
MVKLFNKLWEILVFILDFFIRKVFRISLSDEQWDAFLQFIKFGIVGVSNTLIHYFTYLLCIFAGCHYLIASVIGFMVSVINAFYWNNKYVFVKKENSTRSLWQAFLKTFLSYAGTGLVLENVLLVIWVRILHVPESIAPLVTLLITIPINFILNKFWAFKDRKK